MDVQLALAHGETRICLASPTGGGKTRIASELLTSWMAEGHFCALYTNRRLLIDQTSRALTAAGLEHGVRAEGYDDERHQALQVSSIQTEHSRVTKKGTWHLHPATRILIDECHLQKGDMAKKILEAHLAEGGAYVGLTATPLDLEGQYTHLIVAGNNSKLRACGALVPCLHYGPDEPDVKKLKAALGEDLSEKQQRQVMMTPTILGRVLEWFRRLNPLEKPSLLFAPGVGESIWFAEELSKAGVKSAHIDGNDIWHEGQFYKADIGAKRELLEASEKGDVKVICNRFVLREGVNMPWISHMVWAMVMGSLGTFLQTGGRGLRAHPGKTHLTLQDHGGAWWRHGSLNADRHWALGDTNHLLAGLRAERLRRKRCQRCQTPLRPGNPWCEQCSMFNELEGARCPVCSKIVVGPVCVCGHEMRGLAKSRPVVQLDGTLKSMSGDIFKPRRIYGGDNGPKLWEQMYYRARTDKWNATFAAAFALFAAENNWGWPDRSWPLMPLHDHDFFDLVRNVPMKDLTQKGEECQS